MKVQHVSSGTPLIIRSSKLYLQPQGRSGQVRKISPPPGFDPRSVQPVASRYTNYAIRPTTVSLVKVKLCNALLLMALVCTYVYLQLYNISYEI